MPLRPLLAAALLTCIGCGNRTTTLQSVARDWCLTIRASQVIPVYPLTEDLQPGDVFLVQTSIHDQAEVYKEKGFLPLDQLTTRLQTGTEYQSFYANAYLKGYHDGLPHNRPAAAVSDSDTGDSPDTDEQKRANTGRYTMAKLPAAQFPSYEFDIERGMGMKLAIPVQGIPVGLGLLRTDTATGTIIIRDAFTYGLPGDMLLQRLHAWADRPDVRRELIRLKQSVGDCPIYLRIVNRVYLVGGVDVVLRTVTTTSAGGDVGAPQSINLLSTKTENLQQLRTNADLYKQAAQALGGSLSDMTIDSVGNIIPGGSVRYAYAGSRAVTMQEDFDRLLALGYLGFDVEILPDGSLGPPVATQAVITGQLVPQSADFTPEQRSIQRPLSRIRNLPEDQRARAMDIVMNTLGGELQSVYRLVPAEDRYDAFSWLITLYYSSTPEGSDQRQALIGALDTAISATEASEQPATDQ